MPQYSLANGPLSLFCLLRSDEDIAAHLNTGAFFELGTASVFSAHTDPENKSERWIEVYSKTPDGGSITIKISVLSGNVTTTSRQNGKEITTRMSHILRAEADFIARMSKESFWKTAYYAISTLWNYLETSFTGHILEVVETKIDNSKTGSRFEITMKGAPRGINLREQIPLDVWRERPNVDWLNSTLELPRKKSRRKDLNWSKVIIEIAGALVDTPTARRTDLIKRCEMWLTAKMVDRPYETQTKEQCFEVAKTEFHLLSEGSFDIAWQRACEEVQKKYPDTRWGKAGAPKKRRP